MSISFLDPVTNYGTVQSRVNANFAALKAYIDEALTGLPAQVVVEDTFTRSDSATSLGDPETGGTTWQTSTSTALGVVSNQAKQNTTSNAVWAVTDAGVSDGTVSVDMIVTANSNGLMLRFIDGSNYLRVFVNTLQVYLEKRDAGDFTTLKTWTGAVPAGATTLAVKMDGAVITVTLGSTVVGTHTLSSGDQAKFGAATLHGFGQGSYNSDHRWDNFKVMSLPIPPPGGGGGIDMDTQLKAWTAAEAYTISGSVTRNSDGVATSAAVTWPDGSTGTYTATDTTGGTVNAYNITHVDSGKRVTQPAVTRDGDGNITSMPALTVGAI